MVDSRWTWGAKKMADFFLSGGRLGMQNKTVSQQLVPNVPWTIDYRPWTTKKDQGQYNFRIDLNLLLTNIKTLLRQKP